MLSMMDNDEFGKLAMYEQNCILLFWLNFFHFTLMSVDETKEICQDRNRWNKVSVPVGKRYNIINN